MKTPVLRHVEGPIRDSDISVHTMSTARRDEGRLRASSAVRRACAGQWRDSPIDSLGAEVHAEAGSASCGSRLCESAVGKRLRASMILCCGWFTANPRLIASEPSAGTSTMALENAEWDVTLCLSMCRELLWCVYASKSQGNATFSARFTS